MILPTDRQLEILHYIIACVDRGLPPTRKEIGKHFGIASTNGVQDHLMALARKGYIAVDPLKSRAIAVLRRPTDPHPVPHRMPAGDSALLVP